MQPNNRQDPRIQQYRQQQQAQANQDPYAFIVNGPASHPQGPTISATKQGRALVIALLALVLIVGGIVVNNFLTAGAKEQRQRYVEVAKAQSELVRVSAFANDDNAKLLNTRSYALIIQYSVRTSYADTQKILAARGVKSSDLGKVLQKSKNTKTDEVLKDAIRNNHFDEVFTNLINKQLADYQKTVKAASVGATPAEKKMLEAQFNTVVVLLKQTPEQQREASRASDGLQDTKNTDPSKNLDPTATQ